jgi:HK97 family phage major capsid protein
MEARAPFRRLIALEANLLTPAELRDELGEPGSRELFNHPRPGLLIAAQQTARREAMTELLNASEDRGETELRAADARKFNAHKSTLDLLAVYEAELADSPQQRSADTFKRAGLSLAYVNRENGTYEQHGENGYFRDMVAFRLNGDGAAFNRLQRHAVETEQRIERGDYVSADISREQRDLSRTDGSGGYFVPPAWLMNEYVALARAGRPTANAVTNLPLPPGTDSLNLPKINTGTTTAIQTADNQSVSNTDLADTSVSAGVKTIAGAQNVAIQALEQSPIAFDQIIMADLLAAYATNVNVQVLNGSNANGEVKGLLGASGINSVTYTDTTPTIGELWPKIASAINLVHTNRFLPPTCIVMHPTRWAWMLATLDSSGRPFIVANNAQGATNAVATVSEVNSQGVVGTLQGLPVIVDPSILTNLGAGTNEDRIIVMRASDLYLWESATRTRVLPEVKATTLGVVLQAYGYLAFTAERQAKAISVISGTGLSTPSF